MAQMLIYLHTFTMKRSILLPLIAVVLFPGSFVYVRRPAPSASVAFCGPGDKGVEEVRTLFPSEWGIPYPAGLAYFNTHDHLALLAKSSSVQGPVDGSTIVLITPYEDLVATVNLAFAVDDAINIAYDDGRDHLLLLNRERAEVARVVVGENGIPDPDTLARFDVEHLGLHNAAGMSVDLAHRRLLILDSDALQVVSADIDHEFAPISTVDLASLGAADLRGIAVHATSHNLFVLSPSTEKLFELTGTGQFVNAYDLAALDLVDPRGLAFGPSADRTDGPDTVHLFLADSNLPEGGFAQRDGVAGIDRVYLPLLGRLIGNFLLERQMRLAPANAGQVFGRILEVAIEPP